MRGQPVKNPGEIFALSATWLIKGSFQGFRPVKDGAK
jgi:hypothetical protein